MYHSHTTFDKLQKTPNSVPTHLLSHSALLFNTHPRDVKTLNHRAKKGCLSERNKKNKKVRLGLGTKTLVVVRKNKYGLA